jgi:hypothetical protein
LAVLRLPYADMMSAVTAESRGMNKVAPLMLTQLMNAYSADVMLALPTASKKLGLYMLGTV